MTGMETVPVVIRFQICIFDILNTAFLASSTAKACCDSLSNLYLWHIKYSNTSGTSSKVEVVIRFQICIFDTLNTARCCGSCPPGSCDSLSNLYLWHIKYSCRWRPPFGSAVVIRFQICIFDTLNTAHHRHDRNCR